MEDEVKVADVPMLGGVCGWEYVWQGFTVALN